MFEKRPAGTTYYDHDSHPGRDSNPGQVSHQQRAGLATAGDVMSTWIVAFYDYAEQVLKAQRQFADSVLNVGAPMLDVARDLTSLDANESRLDNQMDARGNQRREGYQVAENARYNDDDTAEYNKRSIDNDMSGNTADTTITERPNTQTDESATTRTRGAASAERKRP
jgi:hypothetical protein